MTLSIIVSVVVFVVIFIFLSRSFSSQSCVVVVVVRESLMKRETVEILLKEEARHCAVQTARFQEAKSLVASFLSRRDNRLRLRSSF